MRRIPLAFALVVAVAGCSGGNSRATKSQTGIQKGKLDSYYFVNIFAPPVNGSITASGATPVSGGITSCSSTNPAGCGAPYTDAQQTTPTYQTAFNWGDSVTLTATGSGTNALIAWAGDCSGTGTCTLSAGADKTVIAIFGVPGSGHPNFMDPAIHGPVYLASVRNANPLRCDRCHGSTLDGMSIAPSCTPCHTAAGHPNWQNDCTFCHGAPPPKYVGAEPNPPHPAVSSDVKLCTGCHPTTVDSHGAIIPGGTHQDGVVQFTGGHPAGFGDKAAHAPAFFDYVSGNGGLDCKYCHGQNYELPIAGGKSCNTCHADAGWGNWQANCSFCHGLKSLATQPGGYDLAANPTYSAPPDAVSQRLSGAAAPTRSGAHANHLTNNSFALAFKCETCHAVPSSLSHIGGSTSRATVKLDGTGQASLPPFPGLGTYDRASGTCSNTYCHGRSSPSPAWSFVGLACGSCHATPPATSSHSYVAPNDLAACVTCHPATMNPTGGTLNVAGGHHVNGLVESTGGHPAGFGDKAAHAPAFFDYVSGNGGRDCKSCHGQNYELPIAGGKSCNSCHADAGWGNWQANCSFCHGQKVSATLPGGYDLAANPTYSAPPDAVSQRLSGAAAPTRSGAHTNHLTNNAFALAFKCETCHAVPANLSHIGGSTSRATVKLDGTGQASLKPFPDLGTYDQASGACLTLCHGNSPSPAWSFVGLACGSCHATPPATSAHSAVAQNDLAACVGCHPATMNPTGGTLNVAGGHHVNGLVEFSGGHPTDWWFPTAHGYSANQQGLQACTSCHTGFGAAFGVSKSSCDGCHATNNHASWQTECTFCHGTAGRAFNQAGSFPGRLVPTLAELAASPPVGPQGQVATTEALVGAHQAHVNPPATGARSIPIACTDCHSSPLPTGVAHVDGLLAPVPFGGIALTGGIGNASFSSSTLTCTNTYCHGNFTGGAGASPVWTAPGPLGCGACHGSPPPTSTTHHPSNTSCGSCHTGYSSTAVVASTHVDGTVQKPSNGCTACHGVLAGQSGAAVDNTNPTLAAPGFNASAVDTAGNSASTFGGVGAHFRHLTPTLRSAGFSCAECHSLPATGNVSHATGTGTGGARATVTFGTLATTGSITTAAYAGSTTATPGGTTGGTCANTYCHGNFPMGTLNASANNTPSWTGGSLSCTGCHTSTYWGHDFHASDTVCGDCHDGYTSSSVNPALHVNGAKNAGGDGTTLGSSWDPDHKTCSNVSCHRWVGPDGW